MRTGIPFALLLVLGIACAGAQSMPQPLPPLNLEFRTTDPNGYPFNPYWTYQSPSYRPNRDARYTGNHCPQANRLEDALCVGSLLDAGYSCNRFHERSGDPDFNGCTTDSIKIDERPRRALLAAGLVAFACENLDTVDLDRASVHGHINWRTVTYEGQIRYSDSNAIGGRGPHAFLLIPIGDGDLDFMLEPKDHRSGLLAGNRTAAHVGQDGNDGLTVEMNIPELLPRLQALPFWRYALDALNNGTSAASPAPAFSAVVTGVLGIDSKHIAHTELHPVYGIAVLYRDNNGTTSWDVFARDWGFEGGCSASPHPLYTAGASGSLAFNLEIPDGYVADLQNSASSSAVGARWESPQPLGHGQELLRAHLASSEIRPVAWYRLELRRLKQESTEEK